MNNEPGRIAQWLRAPTDLELGVLYLLLGFYIAVATDAVTSFIWLNFVLFSLLGVILLAAFRIVLFVFVLQAKKAKGVWMRWAQFGAIALVMVLIFETNLDLCLRVWLSEGALNREVQGIERLPVDGQKRWLKVAPLARGLFNVRLEEVDRESRTMWFHTVDGTDPFGRDAVYGGIVYCEGAQPPERGESTYEHLYGPWWRWMQDM